MLDGKLGDFGAEKLKTKVLIGNKAVGEGGGSCELHVLPVVLILLQPTNT